MLRSGRSGQSAVDLARALLGRHGEIAGLAGARADVLSGYAGMGPAKAAAVAAAFELGRRTAEYAEAVRLRSAADVAAVARRQAQGVRRDEVLLFVTDSANRVRWTVSLLTGVLTRPDLPVRRAIEAVVAHDGAAFAVARLSCDLRASPAPLDEELVRRLRPAAAYAGLRLLDYVVLAETDWCEVLVSDVPPAPPPRVPPLPPALRLTELADLLPPADLAPTDLPLGDAPPSELPPDRSRASPGQVS